MSTQQSEIQPAKPRVVRAYSPTERLNALALYDTTGNLLKTSQTLGIPLSTVAGWVRDNPSGSQLRNEKAQDLAQKFENAANLFLDLAVKKSKKAAFQHLMTAAGISTDKSQLLKGLPTSITQDTQRSELLIVMQSAMESIEPEGFIEAESKQLPE